MELCHLIEEKIIPKEEINRVFRDSESASAEIDLSFLCFEDYYEEVRKNTSLDTTILDLGCAYAPQCWYFKDYTQYIGVDYPFMNNVRFQTENTTFYLMSIQEFIKNILPTLDLDLSKTVAICSMVPDKEALELVKEIFLRHYVVYPTLTEKSVTGLYPEKEQDIER